MKETISVAIPVFNRAAWIARTLEHIFSQTVPVSEVVICDDGSTDDLEAAISPYANKVKVVRIENSGPAIARKTAVEASKGDWIALCDSDDFWRADHIEQFLKAKHQYSDINLYFTNFRTSDKPDQTKFQQAPDGWFTRLTGESLQGPKHFYRCHRPFLGALLEFQAAFQSCLVFRRDLYDELDGILDHVSRWASEDFHLTARMAAVADAAVGVSDTVLINKHEENFSAEYVRNLEGEVRILADLNDRRLVPSESLALIERRLESFIVRLFRSYYWTGQYRKAVDLAKTLPRSHFCTRDWVRLVMAMIRGKFSR